ncbi:hypothetical protein [Paraburkholderia sp. RL17-337-BIB-A]|uniref:hypothetical protein n=1 Tax=Paraburkholderia sp. RL17-337-BIB-A TaxID=3031636 RepID=UPI0038B94D89
MCRGQSRIYLASGLLALICALAGCASVTAIVIDPATGQAKTNAIDGIPYYQPAPYLLVTEVPLDEQATPNGRAGGAGAAPSGDNKSQTGSNASQDGSGTSPSSASDTSFSMFTKQYGLKLIYLPDMSRPMVLQQHPGIGSTQLNASLQNGWMLTSISGSADSKTAETLASIGSLISAAKGGGGSGGTGSATTSKKGGGREGNPVQTPVLPPGLYRLVFDKVTGGLINVCQVVKFSTTGIENASKADTCLK